MRPPVADPFGGTLPWEGSGFGGGAMPPGAPTISGTVTIGGTLTITAPTTGGPVFGYYWYRDGVLAGVVASGYGFSFGDIGPAALTVKAYGAGIGPASNALTFAGLESLLTPSAMYDQTSIGTSWPDSSVAHTLPNLAAGGSVSASTINGVAANLYNGTSNYQVFTGQWRTALGTTRPDLTVLLDDTGQTRGATAALVYNEPCPLLGGTARIGFSLTTSGLRATVYDGANFVRTAYLACDQNGPIVVRVWADGTDIWVSANGGDPVNTTGGAFGPFTGSLQAGDTLGYVGRSFSGAPFWPGKLGTIICLPANASANNELTKQAFLFWKYGVMAEV